MKLKYIFASLLMSKSAITCKVPYDNLIFFFTKVLKIKDVGT